MEIKEIYSNELGLVLNYMEKDLAREELPAPILTPEYFVLAAFQIEDSAIKRRLSSFVSSDTLDLLEATFYQWLQKRALSVIKPDREIKISERLNEILKNADEERKGLDAEKITSEHVFLAILKDSSSENIFNSLLKKVGITYMGLRDTIITKSEEYDENLNEEKKTRSEKNIFMPPPIINKRGAHFQTFIMRPDMSSDSMDDDVPGQEKKIDPTKEYCINLNDLVKAGKIDPLVGREKEIQEIIRVLCRRKKNNVILVGSEGVGKTAIAENLAYKIVNGDVPYFLRNKIVVSLDMTALISGTTLRGMFEGRVKSLLKNIKEKKNCILFIDNIGTALADKGKNDYDISSMLSNSLENGEIQVIGTCDFKSYRSTFDKDPSLGRKFGKVVVDAPSKEDSYAILEGVKPYYEDYHKVTYTPEAVKSCVDLANQYITERNLPDSAIDLLDEAGASVSATIRYPEEIDELQKTIKANREKIENLKKQDDYVAADELEKETTSMALKYKSMTAEFVKNCKNTNTIIDKDKILDLVAIKTGIPVSKLGTDDKKRLVDMPNRLKAKVIGQNEPIDLICKALKRNRVGIKSGKCLYSAILIGKTGVGKTLIAKELAKELFGSTKSLVRFDMSEYPDKTAVNKLIGSNPGYVGYEEGGQLTETIKNKKHCVLLLDEIEKADPEIYNIFLQVLDEGFLTDNSGMKVDFKNVVVLFTSNIGAKSASEFGKGIGFNENEGENSKRILTKELKSKFPPEFLNRLDNILYFNNLTDDNLKDIIKIEIGKLQDKIKEIGHDLSFNEDTVDYLLKLAKEQKEFGARPIARAIQDEIGDKITDLLLENEYEESHMFNITCFSEGGLSVA